MYDTILVGFKYHKFYIAVIMTVSGIVRAPGIIVNLTGKGACTGLTEGVHNKSVLPITRKI